MKFIKKFISTFMIIGLIISCTNISLASSSFGNTNSNIIRGGHCVKSGSSIYSVDDEENYEYTLYYNPWTPMYSHTIYKGTNQVSKVKKIVTNATSTPSINLKDGWIYYIGISSNGNTGIYKVKTNGTKKTRITSIDTSTIKGNLGDYKTMIVKGNYIYYTEGRKGTIKRISTTGKSKKTIYKADGFINSFTMSDNYIYANIVYDHDFAKPNYSPYSSLYKVSISGNYVKRIGKNLSGKYDWSSSQYYKGYIFYINDYGLYRMKTDGSSKKKLTSDIKNNIDYSYNGIEQVYFYNGKIYYIKSGYLKRRNLDGSNPTTLKKGDYSYILRFL